MPHKTTHDNCDGCTKVGVINCLDCIDSERKPAMTKCRNPEMVKRMIYLRTRVEVLTDLVSSELVGPTEWAEAVSLCRYAVDRVGECGGAAVPSYGVSNG